MCIGNLSPLDMFKEEIENTLGTQITSASPYGLRYYIITYVIYLIHCDTGVNHTVTIHG